MAQTFQDKVVIVTGANNGIGAATAALFTSQGAKVAALDIRESTIPSSDTRLNITCNVGAEDEVNAAVQAVVDKWGTIDVLCNIAGVADNFAPAGNTTTESFNRILNVNLHGPFFLIRACLPHFLSKPGSMTGSGFSTVLPPRKGSIINICSTASVRGAAAGAAYTMSKHGLLGLSRNTAWMYRHQGVASNAIMPGGVATNIMEHSLTGGMQGLDLDALGRLKPYHDCQTAVVSPDHIANAILWLAGAPAVNGAELVVDNGWTAS